MSARVMFSLETDAKDVLISETPNGNMDNVDASMALLYIITNAWQIKLVQIVHKIVMLEHSSLLNKKDVFLVQLDV